jgi:hypothetical protein
MLAFCQESNYNCPTFWQSYLGGRILLFGRETNFDVVWGEEKYPEFSLPIHQLPLHVLYTPTISAA